MNCKAVHVLMGLFVTVVLGMTGCGGGSGTPPPTVSGIASEGVLITGKTVKLKDANGKSAIDSITNITSGSYTIDVTGLTAPFLVTVTGTNGTYVSLAQAAGTANINPITTTVVALAAGSVDVPALFTNLTAPQLASINANYTTKTALVTTSLQAAVPSGIKIDDYFTGAIVAGKGMDSVFDFYLITIDPTTGITVKTKGTSVATLLIIPPATVTANTNQSLPVLVVPTSNDFNVGMLSGKTIYSAAFDGYDSKTFKADGTMTASLNTTSGAPVENRSTTWIITTDGKLQFITGGTTTYTLTSINTTESYWDVVGAGFGYDLVSDKTRRLFFNASTGLSQAQNYYNTHKAAKPTLSVAN